MLPFLLLMYIYTNRFPIFEVRTLTESVWNWCNLPRIEICPGVDLTDTTVRCYFVTAWLHELNWLRHNHNGAYKLCIAFSGCVGVVRRVV